MLKKYFNLKTSNDERYCKNDFILFFKRRVSYSKLNLLYYFYDAEKIINSKICFYKKPEKQITNFFPLQLYRFGICFYSLDPYLEVSFLAISQQH